MRNICSVLIFIMAHALVYAGGPWTQKKGEGILIIGVSPVIYSTISGPGEGSADLPRRISEITTQAYVEYGIIDRLTLIGNLPLKYVGSASKLQETDDFVTNLPHGKLFGLSNSTLAAKYNITNQKFLFAASLGIEFPSIGDKLSRGLRTGYEAFTFIPMIHLGQGFSNGIYFFVEGGYGVRNKLSDEWRLSTELGYSFKKPLIMALSLNVKESIKNRSSFDDNANYLHTGLYLNEQEYVSWSFKFIHEVNDHWGWNAALSGGFRTELIALTPVISGGFYYKWFENHKE